MTFLLLPFIGALIGWFTNLIAIKLIFRPLKPIKIPVIGISIQGVIPKRRKQIAHSIGQTVQNELLDMNDIMDQIWNNQNKYQLINKIRNKIYNAILKNIPSFIPEPIKSWIMNYFDNIIQSELECFLDSSIDEMANYAVNYINISKIVEDKINQFELESLEKIIINVAKNELRYIEVLGAVLGCIIGLLQAILLKILTF